MNTSEPIRCRVADGCIFVTKVCKLPLGNVLTVRPSRDGQGACIVTDRGMMHVRESYESIVASVYGDDDPGETQRFGANVGAEVETARGGASC